MMSKSFFTVLILFSIMFNVANDVCFLSSILLWLYNSMILLTIVSFLIILLPSMLILSALAFLSDIATLIFFVYSSILDFFDTVINLNL